MNRAEAKHRAEIMLAWSNGQTIQYRMINRFGVFGPWFDSKSEGELIFDFHINQYRIKPEIKFLWALWKGDGTPHTKIFGPDIKGAAERARDHLNGIDPGANYRVIKMIEVEEVDE